MQIICSGVDGIKVQLWQAIHEYRKMDYGAALRYGCSCENRFAYCVDEFHDSFHWKAACGADPVNIVIKRH